MNVTDPAFEPGVAEIHTLESAAPSWTFLTNHAHVLLTLADDPHLRIRDVAAKVGITERAAQRILHDLVEAGYVERERHGRRNTYSLALDRPLRHPVEAPHTVGELVEALCGSRPRLRAGGPGHPRRT
jgi:DNA-binding transcriptional ArsR family regulator